MTKVERTVLRCAALCFALPCAAFATNGLNVIGFGTESNGMAGADTAVARDTTALNTNPAGLTQITGNALDVYMGLAYALDVRHQDSFGNDRGVSNTVIGVGGFGYARRRGDLSYGIGFFGQGGSGSVYKDLATAFGTRDELSVLLRIAKVTPGVAYRFNERFSLGVSASIAYADITQKIFPDTSFFNAAAPARSFFGSRIDDAYHVSFSPKLGAMYDATDALTFGASFTPRTSLPLRHGTLVSDQSALGTGKVIYRDVHLDGIALPREIAVGMAVHPGANWLVSVKLDWLNWSDALTVTTVTASDPDNAAAIPVLSASTTNNWRDQWVVAVGGVYQFQTGTVLRWGYNYGRNPIPTEHTDPLLGAISKYHLTLGLSQPINAEWILATSLEYAYGGKVTYTNTELPFGPNAALKDNYLSWDIMVSRRW
jgi:long-chain fatty acid transport protein